MFLKTALIAFPAVSGTANMHLHQELLALYAHTSIEDVESSEHGCCRSSFYDKVQYCSGELLEDVAVYDSLDYVLHNLVPRTQVAPQVGAGDVGDNIECCYYCDQSCIWRAASGPCTRSVRAHDCLGESTS